MLTGGYVTIQNNSSGISHAWPVRNAGIAPVASLPRTGQTKCWEANDPIHCFGTGQDGEHRAGRPWPNPRFLDHGDGTVTDLLTNLMWTRDAYPVKRNRSWNNALSDIAALNAAAYLGHTGWRLPNIEEMASLLDLDSVLPSLPAGHPFSSVQRNYWTSTARSETARWYFSPNDVQFSPEDPSKSDLSTFWPVRGGPKPYFIGDAIIVLKVLCGIETPIPSRIRDINGNGVIDMAEAIYILQFLIEGR